jgi:hypothetical protein
LTNFLVTSAAAKCEGGSSLLPGADDAALLVLLPLIQLVQGERLEAGAKE